MKSSFFILVFMFLFSCAMQNQVREQNKTNDLKEAYIAAIQKGNPGIVESVLFQILYCDIHNEISIDMELQNSIEQLAKETENAEIKFKANLILEYLRMDDPCVRAGIKSEYHDSNKMFNNLSDIIKQEDSLITITRDNQ